MKRRADVRDTSLKVPPGVTGTVVEVRVFSRRGVDKDERALSIERAEIERLAKDRDDEKAILERSFYSRLKELLLNQTAVKGPKGIEGEVKVTDKVLSDFTPGQWRQIVVKNDKAGWPKSRRSKTASTRPFRHLRRGSRTRSISCSAATNCRRAL